ncbi:hypothetical protein HQ531_14200 [bacterium]|nr:hypothetical protein [bacterium]
MMKNNTKNSILFIVTISLAIVIGSCERPEAPIPEEHTTISSEILAGWTAYEAGALAADDSTKLVLYEDAISHFDMAAQRNASEVEAYVGLGWSHFRLDNFSSALSQFNFVRNLATEQGDSASIADSYAATGLIKDSQRFIADIAAEDPGVIEGFVIASIAASETALEYDPDYGNTHNPTFGVAEVHKMLAQNYYYRHWYTDALTHLYSSNGFTVSASLPTSTVSIAFSPVLDAETRALTIAPVTIDWDDTLNQFTPGVAVVDIVDASDITDANDGLSLPTMNIFEGNSILLNGADDFDYASSTDEKAIFIMNYPLGGGASRPLALLELDKGGAFEVTEINTWVDKYLTIFLPDGSTYIDTVQEKVPYEGTVEIFDFRDGFPALADTTFGADYKMNYIYLPDEPQTSAGDPYEITYSYAYYTAEFTVTSTFGAYLGALSQEFD